MDRNKIIWLSAFLAVFSVYTAQAASQQEVTAKLNVYNPQSVYIQWAAPEGRVGPDGTNWDTLYYLKVKSGGTTLFTMPTLSSTDVSGSDLTPISLPGIGNGSYDFFIKGHQSLTRKLSGVNISSGLTRLNFTQADNSATLGPIRLLAGDINGSTSSPQTMGDDVVNAVDLGILLDDIDKDDPTNRSIRSNLNQDPVVNSVDMSLMLGNIDKEGDQQSLFI